MSNDTNRRLIAAGAVFSSIESNERASRTEELLSAPRPNDLYVVNVSGLMKNPESPFMYGVLRVKSVQSGRVEFDVPTVTYNKAKGATKDINHGKVSGAGYFAPQTLTMPIAEVQSLKKDGAIHSVERN